MSGYEAADLLRHIEHLASGDPRRVAVLELWRVIESGGWTASAFLEGLDRLLLEGVIELVGDRLVLKLPNVAQPLHRRQ